MPIAMQCPGCKTKFEFANDLQGKRIKCKSCGDIFRVEKPVAKSKADDDRPAVKSASRRQDEDERPKAMASSAFRDRDDDDRPSARNRRPVDDDDDRPPSRTRRPVDDDEDDRRSGSYRRRPMDDDEDDRPRSRRDYEDDEDDKPRKKKSPLFVLGAIAGALALLIGVAAVIYIVTKKGKDGHGGAGGDVVKAPAKACPLEVAEKDAGTLVLPDSGNLFGLLRKGDTLKKTWTLDLYDMGAGRRTGRLDITDMDEPRSVSLSPDGKHFLAMEASGFNADPTIRLWSVAENKLITQEKWNPYPNKARFDSPNLYRAEIVANDRVMTISSGRFLDVFTIPTFERPFDPIPIGAVRKAEFLGRDDRTGAVSTDKYQRQVALSADKKLIAVWNGDGFSMFDIAKGDEIGATTSAVGISKQTWPRESFNDRVKGGPVAFSPDGKIFAAILTHDFHPKRHVLCLWDVKDITKEPAIYELPSNQFNDAPSINWWGNRYIVTHGAKVEGMLIDKNTGIAKRQLMGPQYGRYGFGRDGRLWYASSEEMKQPATMYVVDAIDADQLTEPDDYEQIVQLNEEFFLRRLWLEPGGVLRKPTRFDPPLQQRLIRRP